ncbi:MAG TPA: hypothetical protein VKB34_09700 [Povalibacter sp.]|nr:hypothetical protein [Povalibacter sp.]
MFDGELEEGEKRDIREQVARILRDLGNPEPPLHLADVRALLSLDLQYYRSSDPGLVSELTHRFRLLAHKTLPDLGRHLLSALSKSRLCAFWVPESSRILVDEDVPRPRHRWIEAHEIIHSVTPWHRHFLLGDNVETLDPTCRAVLEAEANYGAGRLLSLQDRLTSEARDLALTFPSIKLLARRYANSIVSTFWRSVEDRDPTQPVFGIISIHPHHPEIGHHDGPYPWRHFIRSDAFRTQFPTLGPEMLFALIEHYASHRQTGPVFTAVHVLPDALGEHWEFHIDSFSTKHALLTLGFPIRRCPPIVQVAEALSN